MIEKIKALADEAIKLQNKNRMDEVLREISSICGESKEQYEQVTYGIPKEFNSEAEMIESIQGIPSTVFTIKKEKKGAKNGK